MDYFRGIKVPSKLAQEFLFFSTALGHLKDKNFFIDRKSFNDNLVMFVLYGKLHVEQNGHFTLTQNQGIILRLTKEHKYYTDERDTCEILWIHFNGRQSEMFLDHLENSYEMPAIFEERRVAVLIQQCFTIYNANQSQTEFLISETIYSILMSISHSLCNEKEQMNLNPRTEFMNKAIRYLDDNLYNKISLGEFAHHFNISQYHFCRVFEKYFHLSPVKYALMKKIEFSKYLLTYTSDSITSIAMSLGFVDQSHFSKTFKVFQGISPLKYRKGNDN